VSESQISRSSGIIMLEAFWNFCCCLVCLFNVCWYVPVPKGGSRSQTPRLTPQKITLSSCEM
jgi:hypothetical protein